MTSFSLPRRFRAFRLIALLILAGALLAAPAQAQDAAASSEGNASASADSAAAEADGRFERRDPQRTRLFFSSTARPIGSGEVYASLGVPLVQAEVGVGNRVSVRGGVLGFQYGRSGPEYSLGVTPRVTLLRSLANVLGDDVPLDVAIDAQTIIERRSYTYRTTPLGPLRTETDWGVAVLPRVVGTYGAPEAALTVGVGPLLSDDGVSSPLAATLGGEVQLLEWLKLISENRVFFGAKQRTALVSLSGSMDVDVREERSTMALLTGGPRFMWDHFALETGAGATAGQSGGDNLLLHLRLSYRF